MSADRPLVTALINTYNYGRYLPFAINSVLDQTYPNIEIIVIDDGSTDHTADILSGYRDKVRWVRTENGGQGHAFNIGIPLASGELVMMLDADDTWLPKKVERMVEVAGQRPKAVMLYHRFQNVGPKGNKLGAPQPHALTDGNYRRKYIRSGGSWWSPITSVLTVRAQHIKRALPIPTYALREGADTLLTDFCALTGEIASVPDTLTNRLLHGSNLYASGRDDRSYRSKETREADVRRIEWRMFCLRQAIERDGGKFNVDLDRNEWRVTNLYWLGRVSLWDVIWASLRCPEHSMKERVQRLKWVLANKRLYRED